MTFDPRKHPLRSVPKVAPGNVPIIGGRDPRTQQLMDLPPAVHDMYNRPLGVGDIVHLQANTRQPFEVVSIVDAQRNNGPAGFMDVELVCHAMFRAPRSQMNQEFVRCLTAEERNLKVEPQATPGPTGPEPPTAPLDPEGYGKTWGPGSTDAQVADALKKEPEA